MQACMPVWPGSKTCAQHMCKVPRQSWSPQKDTVADTDSRQRPQHSHPPIVPNSLWSTCPDVRVECQKSAHYFQNNPDPNWSNCVARARRLLDTRVEYQRSAQRFFLQDPTKDTKIIMQWQGDFDTSSPPFHLHRPNLMDSFDQRGKVVFAVSNRRPAADHDQAPSARLL